MILFEIASVLVYVGSCLFRFLWGVPSCISFVFWVPFWRYFLRSVLFSAINSVLTSLLLPLSVWFRFPFLLRNIDGQLEVSHPSEALRFNLNRKDNIVAIFNETKSHKTCGCETARTSYCNPFSVPFCGPPPFSIPHPSVSSALSSAVALPCAIFITWGLFCSSF